MARLILSKDVHLHGHPSNGLHLAIGRWSDLAPSLASGESVQRFDWLRGLIWSPLSPHWNCTERLAEAMVSSEVPVLGISIQWFFRFNHWALITVH